MSGQQLRTADYPLTHSIHPHANHMARHLRRIVDVTRCAPWRDGAPMAEARAMTPLGCSSENRMLLCTALPYAQ